MILQELKYTYQDLYEEELSVETFKIVTLYNIAIELQNRHSEPMCEILACCTLCKLQHLLPDGALIVRY